jgi:hypothetical protein
LSPFIADAHQPLHVGFKKDDCGTKTWLKQPVNYHLHKVWDSYIISRYLESEKDNNKHRLWNYYAIANDVMDEIDSSDDVWNLATKISPPIDTFDYSSVKAYAAAIVSETSRLYTCDIAYKHEPMMVALLGSNGKKIGSTLVTSWIQYHDTLSEVYLDRGLKVVKIQYMRAGIRLAKLLNAIADQYYIKKDAERAASLFSKKSAATKAATLVYKNQFAALQSMIDDVDLLRAY